MNERLVLDAVAERPPRRMKQPTKDTIRGWLRDAETRVAQLQADMRELRAKQLPADERTRLVADLAQAAAALGHHKSLRSSSDRTIHHWQARVDALAATLKGDSMDVEKIPAPTCTCPSGDGSLRSPCPAHGALPAIGLQHEALGFVLFPLSPAAVAPHVVEYIVGFDFDEVRDVYGERFAVFWQGLVALFLGQPSAQVTLAARQPVASVAWLIHWSHIPLEAPEITTSASRVDAVSALTDPPRIEPLYAAPPAQGIDPGQLRALAEQWKQLEYPFSYEGNQAQRATDACRADLLALIDQRDAAPGVSS